MCARKNVRGCVGIIADDTCMVWGGVEGNVHGFTRESFGSADSRTKQSRTCDKNEVDCRVRSDSICC